MNKIKRLRNWALKSMFCDLMPILAIGLGYFGLLLLSPEAPAKIATIINISSVIRIISAWAIIALGFFTIILYLVWFHIPGFKWEDD